MISELLSRGRVLVKRPGRLAKRFMHSARHGRVRRAMAKTVWLFAPWYMKRRACRLTAMRLGSVQAEAADDPLILAAEVQRLQYRPLISVLLPVYNTQPHYLSLAVDSILAQAYPEWETILCDDGSTDKETLAALDQIADLDPRLRVVHLKANSGISAATNAALAKARGEFVTMLDHDDELLPAALLEVAKKLDEDRALDVVYTDQDCIEPDGTTAYTFFKPDWSLEMFRGVMYVGHLLVVRRSLAEAVGGFDSTFDNVQDFEFMLRLAEKTDRIAHVPKILYHWRRIPGSVALGADEKSDINVRQAAAVTAHLKRVGIKATASPNPGHPHRVLITPDPQAEHPLVSVIVRAAGVEDQLKESCRRLFAVTTYPNTEVIVTGGRLSGRLRQYLESLGAVVVAAGEGGGAAATAALERAQGELLVCIAGDLSVETPEWLEHLHFASTLDGIACVAPLILGADGKVSSAGLIVGGDEVVIPAMRGWQAGIDGYAGSLCCMREVSAVPGDCFAVARKVLSGLGGLGPYMTDDYYQAVDLSLRASEAGLHNLYTPRAVVRRLKRGAPRTGTDTLDALLLLDVWQPLAKRGDPFHNPNFKPVAPGYQT